MKTIVADPQGEGWKVVKLSFIGDKPPAGEDDTDPDPTSPAGAALRAEDHYEEFQAQLAA